MLKASSASTTSAGTQTLFQTLVISLTFSQSHTLSHSLSLSLSLLSFKILILSLFRMLAYVTTSVYQDDILIDGRKERGIALQDDEVIVEVYPKAKWEKKKQQEKRFPPLSLSLPVSPCLSLSLPVSPCLSLSLPVSLFLSFFLYVSPCLLSIFGLFCP
jgi:hypothetical protein